MLSPKELLIQLIATASDNGDGTYEVPEPVIEQARSLIRPDPRDPYTVGEERRQSELVTQQQNVQEAKAATVATPYLGTFRRGMGIDPSASTE